MKFMSLFFCSTLVLSLFVAAPSDASPFKDNNRAPSLSQELHGSSIRQKIMTEFSRWKGVKYRLGGTTSRGIDCSSLMQKIYHAAFDDRLTTRLPRTTAQQLNQGVKASRNGLKPGDLIFFKMSSTERHVGVYIGDEKFVHASTSQGVIISSLENDYWSDRFKTARRIIG